MKVSINKLFFVNSMIFTLFFIFIPCAVFSEDTDTWKYTYLKKDWAIKGDLAWELNSWLPDQSFYLEYDITGMSLLKGNFNLTTTFKYLPEVVIHFETNLGGAATQDILLQHRENDGLKNVYNKFNIIGGWVNRIEEYKGQYNHYNPWRPNTVFDLEYTRETFRIAVTPQYHNLYFMDYSGTVYELEDTLTMYTKFEELQFNTDSHGILVLWAFFQALFNGSQNGEGLMKTDLDTRIGAYISTWQKPYQITQVISMGDVSGYDNVIYASKFWALGATEKFYWADKYFYWASQTNMGIAWVNLTDDQVLVDSTSPVFMHFKIKQTVGCHIPLAKDRLTFNLYGEGDWGCMVGVAPDPYDDTLSITSFITSDLLLKVIASVTIIL